MIPELLVGIVVISPDGGLLKSAVHPLKERKRELKHEWEFERRKS